MTTSGQYSVNCMTCHVNVYEGDTQPKDGQPLLTTFAESVPGTACPSKVDPCPNKSAVINQAPQRAAVTKGDLASLVARIEAKVGKLP